MVWVSLPNVPSVVLVSRGKQPHFARRAPRQPKRWGELALCANSGGSPALTKFARSNHAKEASVSGQVNAPPVDHHGESEINTLTIPLTQRFLEGITRQSRVGRICRRQMSPRTCECRFATSLNWRMRQFFLKKVPLRVQGRALPSNTPSNPNLSPQPPCQNAKFMLH